MALHIDCEGFARRDFLRAGSLALGGLSLGSYLRMASAGEVSTKAKAKAAIFVNLRGGPSHMDMFDPKPDAAAEYRESSTRSRPASPEWHSASTFQTWLPARTSSPCCAGSLTHSPPTNWELCTSILATGRCRRWSSGTGFGGDEGAGRSEGSAAVRGDSEHGSACGLPGSEIRSFGNEHIAEGRPAVSGARRVAAERADCH